MAKSKKNLIEYDGKMSKDCENLNQYMYQYKDCVREKRHLSRRLQEVNEELKRPASVSGFDGMPKSKQPKKDNGTAVLIRIEEISERINSQIDILGQKLDDIMSILDFLPVDSQERGIMENLYIDRWGWDKVCKENHISRSQAKRYWKSGLYCLLEFPKVREILKNFLNKDAGSSGTGIF